MRSDDCSFVKGVCFMKRSHHRLTDKLSETRRGTTGPSLGCFSSFQPLRHATVKHSGRKKFLLSLSNRRPGCDTHTHTQKKSRSDPSLPRNCTFRYARSRKNLLLCFLNPVKRSAIWTNNLWMGE